MYALLMALFIFITFCLAVLILMQQGKGDLGLSALGGGTQVLFGGSGGKSFFEKATWVLGAIFIFGALGLAILKSKLTHSSRLEGITMKKMQQPTQNALPQELDQQATNGDEESSLPEAAETNSPE